MSSFFILSMTSITRPAFLRSGSARSPYSIVGTICHERPYRSFTQPHCSASGTAERAFQYRSTSAWLSHGTVKETASLNLKYGPPFRPLNFRPISVKSTDRTSPLFPLGKSAGAFLNLSSNQFPPAALLSGWAVRNGERNGKTYLYFDWHAGSESSLRPARRVSPPKLMKEIMCQGRRRE